MSVVSLLEDWLLLLANKIPVELFAFIGALVEEIIAPIPSPFVMTITGSIAHAQHHSLVNLFWLAMLGAFGKTLGALLLYLIADKTEDVIVPKFGKFFGIKHEDVEKIGEKIDSGWGDNFFIFISRALPVVPSAPISIVSGILKINLKTYTLNTFLGSLLRNVFYLYIGYTGIESYKSVIAGLDGAEAVVKLAIILIIVGLLGWAYIKRGKQK
jgi:membrane protein DedA with SNARE-associated domain